ncbi:protein starmaker-like [Arabidopsis lyrata subsp. lyrata]|uniref:protein starmaker-like n=1 Tax=Arabidopsis lyrata subsp. lyrata TaxID=81972 RepID=UPI000A29AF12|nr:protein starmaker-like [Arabidopsis lyrata subsp. lyrata]|eukprot:XP_020871414.1 protein starmaker-like [Arabidopsis lyrata subsp. lyrata]
MIMFFMLQDVEKTAPESARKEADMSDNESAGLYYGGPSDEDEVICDGGEYDKGPLDSATKQQDKSDTEMADISEDDKDVFPAEEHKTGDDEDVLPEDETKTGDDQDMLHQEESNVGDDQELFNQEESNVGDDQELFNAPSSPKRGADELEASPADEPTIAGQRNAGGAIGVDGNLSSMPSPSSVLTELGTFVDVTAGTNVIEEETKNDFDVGVSESQKPEDVVPVKEKKSVKRRVIFEDTEDITASTTENQEEPKKDACVEGSDGQIPDDSKDVEILIETKESSSNSACEMGDRLRGFPKNYRCGEPIVMKTSKTARNPGRLFHACPFGDNDNRYHVFKWTDSCMVEEIQDLIEKVDNL